MAEILGRESREIETVIGYKCDGCGKEFNDDDWAEKQEMLHWRNRGGWGSIFGDGTQMALDICQSCIEKRLGDIVIFHYED